MLVTLALALAAAPGARAAAVIVIDQDRFVEANSDAASGGQTAFEINDDRALDDGPFLAAVDAESSTTQARGDGSSDQHSLLSRMSLEAFGTTDATALVLASPGPSASASAISFFEVSFEVDETGRFLLEGAIDSFANPAGDGLAEVWLTAPALAQTLLFRSVAGVELDVFSELVTLLPGVVYVLTAFSTADAFAFDDESFSSAISGYHVGLSMVPEPGAALLLALALGAALRAKRG